MTDQKQCKHVTKKKTQCKGKALPGSEYCRIHQPREIWLPFFIGIVLSIIITILITSHFSQKSFESDLSLRHISRPRNVPAIGGFPVVIDDGINVIINQSGFVTHKVKDGSFDYRINEDGAIKIYGEIRRTDGTIVVEATGDRVNVLPSTGLDINSDSRACEIVDSEKNPIFRISVIPFDQWKKRRDEVDALLSQANEVVELYYIHRTGDNWCCVTPEGSQRVDNRESMKEWQSKIPRLFKYPGEKYLGVRLNNQSQ